MFAAPERWPERVIAMTLARVGAGAGPDLERLKALRVIAPGKRLYAAGGVRGPDDLRDLRALGCAGVLVASALHDGRLGAASTSRASDDGADAARTERRARRRGTPLIWIKAQPPRPT